MTVVAGTFSVGVLQVRGCYGRQLTQEHVQ